MQVLNRQDCTHISPTSLWTAHVRQGLCIPYADQVARLVDTATAAARFRTSWEAEVTTTVYLEGRYWTIDRLVRESGIRQVIVLATGLQTYCMDWTASRSVHCVETDLPNVIALKERISDNLVGNRPNLSHRAFDVTGKGELAELTESLLDRSRETLVISEGLLPYLGDEEQSLVTGKIARFLRTCGGLWVTTDLIQRPPSSPNAMQELRRKMTQETRREINTFASQDEIRTFLAAHNLVGERHRLNGPPGGLRSARKLGITLEEAETRLERFEAFLIRLAD